jgi:signal peptidase II
MANTLWENSVKFTGPLTRIGLLVAALVFASDQLTKYWILRIINLDEREPIQLTPFLDLAMAWNKGVSYGLLTTQLQYLLVALSVIIAAFIFTLLAKATKPLSAAGYGLLIGGALGNALDRMLHGAVADFVHLHWGTWSWYIFNVADIAIVAGVAVLLYDAVFESREA